MKQLKAQYPTFAETEKAVIKAMEDLHRGGLSFDTISQEAKAPKMILDAVSAGIEHPEDWYRVDSSLYLEAFLQFIEARYLAHFGGARSKYDRKYARGLVRYYFTNNKIFLIKWLLIVRMWGKNRWRKS